MASGRATAGIVTACLMVLGAGEAAAEKTLFDCPPEQTCSLKCLDPDGAVAIERESVPKASVFIVDGTTMIQIYWDATNFVKGTDTLYVIPGTYRCTFSSKAE